MKQWKRVTSCPFCGGELEISEHYVFSRDYKITKKGLISKKYTLSSEGPMDCVTGFCLDCETAFDSDMITVEHDGTVYIKIEED